MPIDRTPQSLRREIDAALALRRKKTAISRELIRQYEVSDSREAHGSPESGYCNHAFEWMANFVPSMVSGLPAVNITDAGLEDPETEALTIGFKGLMPQIKLARTLQRIAYDIPFDFGVGMVRLEPTPGLKEPAGGKGKGGPRAWKPMRPTLDRVSPRMYFEDARGPEFGKARFAGHIVIADRAEMLAATTAEGKPKFDKEAIERIGSEEGLREVQAELMQEGVFFAAENQNQIVYFEIYLPEHNSWVCLGFNQGSAEFLREERQYKGPRDGPYQKFGIYLTPDQVYPLATLAVTRKQVEEINRHRAQISRDAGAHKRLVIVDGAEAGIIAQITSSQSSSVISAPGFSGKAVQLELGGAMKGQVDIAEFLQGKLDRAAGLSNTARGDVKAGTTATSDAIAEQHTDARDEYAKNQFREATSECLGKMAELMDTSDQVAFKITVPQVDPQTGEQYAEAATFFGGKGLDQATAARTPGAKPSPWERTLTVEIEPYSMEYVNQAERRAAIDQFAKVAIDTANAMLQNPAIKGQPILDDYGQTLNIAKAGSRYIDFRAIAQQVNQMRALAAAEAAAAMGGQPGGPPGAPGAPAGAGPAMPPGPPAPPPGPPMPPRPPLSAGARPDRLSPDRGAKPGSPAYLRARASAGR